MRSKRLELQETLKNQRPSTLTKRQETLQKLKSSSKKPRVALVDGPREKEIVTDEVDERLNDVALEKKGSSTTIPSSTSGNGQRGKEIVTDEVDERPNDVALEKKGSSTTKPCLAFVYGRREKGMVTNAAVCDRFNAVALEKQKSLTIKPCITFVHGRRGKEIVTDAVGERLNAVALEKQKSSTTKPCSEITNGSWADEIASIAVEARLNAVALKKRRSSTKKPCSAFVNGSRADEIVTDPVDERFNAVADMLDAGNDIRGEDADTLDMESDIRDEDADILDADGNSGVQIVGDQSLPTNSDEDADVIDTWNDIKDEDAEIHDLYGGKDMQSAEDQWLSTDSDEDADIFDADGDMHIMEDQSLPTNSERVAGSPRERKHDKVRRLATDPHNESNNTNWADNGQASTSRPSGNRRLIIFDKYGRPCDVGSEKFATDIGKIVRAHSRPAIESWKIVPNNIKENIWKNVVAKYVVPEVYKPSVLLRANTSWRAWKYLLRLELDKHETIAERKLNIPYRLITEREDWESFVDFCNTDEDRKRRAAGKKAREAMEFMHSCGRKGIYRKIYELEKASPTGEVNRSAIFLDTHVSKTINDPASSSNSDIKLRLIKELVEAYPDGQKDIDNDAVALVCGRDAKGVVKGMGGGVSGTKVRASAASVEFLRKVQQENTSLKSDIQLLITQSGKNTQNHTFTPANQSASQAPDASNLPPRSRLAPDVSNVPARSCLSPPASNLPASSRLAPPRSNLPARSRLAPDVITHSPARSHFTPPDMSDLAARSHLVPPASNLLARSHLVPPASNSPISSHLALPVSNSPARSHLALPVSNSPARSHLALPVSNSPARSHLALPASNLPASSCFIKNFKGRTIALGCFNTASPPTEHVYSLIIEDIFDRDAELFDRDGKLGDITIGGVVNWPKACVESNLPANSCFVRNFKRRTIAFGSFSTAADPQMEHVYSITVQEIYDKDADLFDTDGKIGDIMIGGAINWPKACIKPCRQ